MAERKGRNPKTSWTPEMERQLIDMYPNHTNAECAAQIGVPETAVKSRAFKLQLRKDKTWMLHKASKGQFKKGHPPSNKGKTWDEYMPPEKQKLARRTCFKKGRNPHNKRPVGYERKDRKQGYWLVKVAEPNVFRFKHRVLWEQHHGPIPKGMNITFIDGNPDNITIENLRMESMKEKFDRCCSMYSRFPEDVRYMIKLKGVLSRQINKLNKDNGKDRKHRKTQADEEPAMGLPE